MNVSDFQRFIDALSGFLEDNAAKGCSAEFRRMRDALQPFAELSVVQFADFLARAEGYDRTGIVPAKASSRRSKPLDAEKVRAALAHIQQLYENAVSESVSYSQVNAEVKKLGKSLSKDEAIALARAFNIARALSTKTAALAAIEGRITDRKESHDRAHR